MKHTLRIVFGIPLIALCCLFANEAAAEITYGPFPLNGQGFICEWLIAGPFPNSGTFPEFSGWDTDWLAKTGGEANADPQPNQSVLWNPPADAITREICWAPRLLESEENRVFDYIIDFLEFYRVNGCEISNQSCISYAFCRLNADRDMDAVLYVSSDDGSKLWLNGDLKAEHREFSSLDASTWKIPVHLKRGANRLLVKVEEGGKGMHGFQVKVLDADGQPAAGITVSL